MAQTSLAFPPSNRTSNSLHTLRPAFEFETWKRGHRTSSPTSEHDLCAVRHCVVRRNLEDVIAALFKAKHRRHSLSSEYFTHTSFPSASTASVFLSKPLTTYLSMAGVNARASAIRNGTTSRANVRNPAVKPKSWTSEQLQHDDNLGIREKNGVGRSRR